MFKTMIHDNMADCVTGERVFPGDIVFDTTYPNATAPFMLNGRSRVIKEETIVWLAEQAGYTLTKRDAGDSGNAKVVDGEDAGVGGGEVAVGKPKAGGRKKPAGSADGTVEG